MRVDALQARLEANFTPVIIDYPHGVHLVDDEVEGETMCFRTFNRQFTPHLEEARQECKTCFENAAAIVVAELAEEEGDDGEDRDD